MTVQEMYQYLVRARRDLWAALDVLPDELLSKQLLQGEERHCIKDLLFHIPSVEDGWVNEDILRKPALLESIHQLKDTPGGSAYRLTPLQTLLEYWQAVEQNTLSHLPEWAGEELSRIVTVHGGRFAVAYYAPRSSAHRCWVG